MRDAGVKVINNEILKKAGIKVVKTIRRKKFGENIAITHQKIASQNTTTEPEKVSPPHKTINREYKTKTNCFPGRNNTTTNNEERAGK